MTFDRDGANTLGLLLLKNRGTHQIERAALQLFSLAPALESTPEPARAQPTL